MKLIGIGNILIGLALGISGYWAGLISLTVGCVILAVDVLCGDDEEESESC